MTNGFRLAFQIGQIARRVGGLMRVRAESSYPPKWTVSGPGFTTMSSPGRVADTAAIDTNAAMNTARIAPADVRSRTKE